MHVLTDCAYREATGVAGLERCVADLHLPATQAADCLVWLHGGGLTEGAKGQDADLARTMLAEGWAVVLPNYRLLQHASWPADRGLAGAIDRRAGNSCRSVVAGLACRRTRSGSCPGKPGTSTSV